MRWPNSAPTARACAEIRSGVEVTRAEGLAAGRWPNPRFTFNRESVAGVTENMFMLAQPLPITGRRGLEVDAAAAMVAASEQRANEAVRQVRAALRRAYADLVGAQLRETEMTASRERLRGLAEALGRREAAGDAAGYDRLRAEREVIEIDADMTAAQADRARAQAALAGFFARTTDPATLVAAAPQAGVPRQPLPTVEELVSHAESQLPELAALKRDQESASLASSAAGRRPIPEPEIVGGTKSSNVAGGDVGTVFSVHVTIPLFDHAKPNKPCAQARRKQADARTAVFQAVLHADLAALRTDMLEHRTGCRQLSGIDCHQRGPARTGSLRSATTLASAAFSSWWTPIGIAVRRGFVRSRLDAAVRQAEIELELVSGSEIR